MKYNPNSFIDSLSKRVSGKGVPKCPICGGENFTTTENFVTFPISQEYNNVVLGPNIPAGMLICENCGHMEFFALGVLNLLKKGEQKNEQD